MQTLTKTKSKSITNTQLAIATLAVLAAGGMAFIVFPSVRVKQIYPERNKKAFQSAALIATSSISVIKDAALTDGIINAGRTSQKLGRYVIAVSGQEDVKIDTIHFFILPATTTTATMPLSNLVVRREDNGTVLAANNIVFSYGPQAPFVFPISLVVKANTKISLGIYVDPLPLTWGSLSTRVPAGGVTGLGQTSGQPVYGPAYYVDGQTMMAK